MQASTATAAPPAPPRSAPKPRGQRSSADTWPKGENWLYAEALACMRRARAIDATALASTLEINRGAARQMLQRMHEEGAVTGPDMFGVYTRTGGAA